MKEKKNIDEMFGSFKGQWDIEEPALGHQQRFLDRLEKPKRKIPYTKIMSIAASILILFAIVINQKDPQKQVAKMSRENKETQQYFNSIIKKELAELKKESDPESKKIIDDALRQMDLLDKDYQKLINELSLKGENKQIIHAMIVNLQTRISFLEEVALQIENIKQIKANYHEKNTL
jgi:hypothetical protein